MMQKNSRQVILLLMICFMVSSCGIPKKTQKDIPFSIPIQSNDFPMPIGYVNDFEDILSDNEERQLTKIIKKHEKNTTDQIAVMTITSLDPKEDLEDYTINVANYWGVGQKNEGKGILIALGKKLRKIRIQNGYGIVDRLSDAETQQIIDEIMIPEFKEDEYFQGLIKGIQTIIEELQQ